MEDDLREKIMKCAEQITSEDIHNAIEFYKDDDYTISILPEPAMSATELINKLRYDIKCINDKLERANIHKNPDSWSKYYLNDYQIVRLKAIRMKCKEIIKLLTGGKE